MIGKPGSKAYGPKIKAIYVGENADSENLKKMVAVAREKCCPIFVARLSEGSVLLKKLDRNDSQDIAELSLRMDTL